jgi:hypothetical protein
MTKNDSTFGIPFLAAWIGGVGGVLVSHPLDVIRTQQGSSSGGGFFATSRDILSTPRGWRAFYAGILSPCLSIGMYALQTFRALVEHPSDNLWLYFILCPSWNLYFILCHLGSRDPS